MQMTTRAVLITPIVLMLLLTFPLTSCQTSPENPAPAVNIPAPLAVSWPELPDPVGKVARLPDGRVALPAEYWMALSKYIIDVEAGIEIVEAYRALWGE